MKTKTIILGMCLLLITLLQVSCAKKNYSSNRIEAETETVVAQEELQGAVSDSSEKESNNYEKQLEDQIKEKMKNFPPAIEFCAEYSFEPLNDYDLKLVDFIVNEENIINCFYDSTLLCSVDCIKGVTDKIYNNCIPTENGWAYSAGFETSLDETNYYGLINLNKGILKVYKSLQYEHQATPPFYSGNSKYFVIENIGVVREAYYDTKTFKNVKEQYGGFLEVYDFETNDLVFKIDRSLLHKTMSLSIEKIDYIDDNFHIEIGNYYDSNEFVDFNLSRDEEGFHYIINDSFSYDDDI